MGGDERCQAKGMSPAEQGVAGSSGARYKASERVLRVDVWGSSFPHQIRHLAGFKARPTSGPFCQSMSEGEGLLKIGTISDDSSVVMKTGVEEAKPLGLSLSMQRRRG